MSRWLVVSVMVSCSWGCKRPAEAPGEPSRPAEKNKDVKEAPAGPGLKRVSVTMAQARSWGLPPVTFTLTCPEAVEVDLARPGRRNLFYVLLTLNREGKMSESVSVSHVDLRGGSSSRFDALAPVVMKRLQSALLSQLPGMKVVSSGKTKFGGVSLWQFRTTFQIKDASMGEPGRYKSIWLALLPGRGARSPNGASLTMAAREGSGTELTTFDDFATKGLPAQVWRSFRIR